MRAPGALDAGRGAETVWAVVVGLALRLLGATWRVEILGTDPRRPRPPHTPGRPLRPGRLHAADDPQSRPQLAALLHESLVLAAWIFRDAAYGVAVSRSRDGHRVAAVLRRLGYAEPVRGSSSRGGPALLRGLLRQLEAGTTVAVLVDGPRGPARVAKPGIATLARHSATPIQPVALAARPALRLGSWDRSVLPLPFARIVCAFGEPIPPPGRAAWMDEEAVAARVGEALVALQDAAERQLVRRAD